MAARCKLPFALRPGLSQEGINAHQRNYERENKGKSVTEKKEEKEPTRLLLLVCGCHEGRCWQEQRWFPPGTQLLRLQPPLLFPLPALPALSFRPSFPTSSLAGTSLLTSVVERKSSTVWLHLLSARKSRILNRLFPLPLSFRTSAHRIFC